ncbi:MAG: hypothetical protein ACYTEL_05530 [Planctomycetota bacterium]|jgi:hypothetical protein
MRKISGTAVLAASLFVITVMFTGIAWLAKTDYVPKPMTEADLAKGHIHLLFLSKEMWANYPSVPDNPRILVQLPTLLTSGCLFLVVWFSLCHRKRYHIVRVGLACLGIAAIHYLAGILALSGNTEVDTCGVWIAVMLLSVLYSALACFVFACLDIFNIDLVRLMLKIFGSLDAMRSSAPAPAVH